MDDLAAAAAAALSAPETLVVRSARARAKADGLEAEAVLASWSGGETAPHPADEQPAPAPQEAPAAEPAAAAEPEPAAAEPLAAAEPESPAAAEPESGPVPDAPARPADQRPPRFESEESAAAAGAIPRWLAAAFIVIPLMAVLYALFLPNGPNCGDAGRLAVSPITGEAANCDLSPYGAEVVDFFAIGRGEFAICSACHGENGAGAGNFPAFVGGALLATFPEGRCEEQVDWVSAGTAGWPEPAYGATAKPVGGSGAIMPAFGGVLTETELRAVVLYERVQFGGQALDVAVADCGLAGGTGETAAGGG